MHMFFTYYRINFTGFFSVQLLFSLYWRIFAMMVNLEIEPDFRNTPFRLISRILFSILNIWCTHFKILLTYVPLIQGKDRRINNKIRSTITNHQSKGLENLSSNHCREVLEGLIKIEAKLPHQSKVCKIGFEKALSENNWKNAAQFYAAAYLNESILNCDEINQWNFVSNSTPISINNVLYLFPDCWMKYTKSNYKRFLRRLAWFFLCLFNLDSFQIGVGLAGRCEDFHDNFVSQN